MHKTEEGVGLLCFAAGGCGFLKGLQTNGREQCILDAAICHETFDE